MGKSYNKEKIEEIVTKIKEMGMSYVDGANAFGIPVGRIYEFNRRKKRGDKIGKVTETETETMTAETSAFDKSPLPTEVQKLIIEHRKQNPDHGFKRIEDHLKGDRLLVVKRKQIRQVLKAHGLLEQHDSSFDREQPGAKGTRRFEASYAGELYQMDVSHVYLKGIPVLYLVIVVDDYSRYCVGAELCYDHRGDTLIGVLHNACVVHGTPRKLLTDQGTGFYSWGEKQTLFQQYLDDRKIEHIVCDPHSPQTQGKVERLIQTVKRECFGKIRFNGYADARRSLADYIRDYNCGRPHQGISGFRPADRFHGVIGERSRIEADLAGREIDFSKGYCIFKVERHCVGIVSSGEGIQVLLDGKLLQEIPCPVTPDGIKTLCCSCTAKFINPFPAHPEIKKVWNCQQHPSSLEQLWLVSACRQELVQGIDLHELYPRGTEDFVAGNQIKCLLHDPIRTAVTVVKRGIQQL